MGGTSVAEDGVFAACLAQFTLLVQFGILGVFTSDLENSC
jgi:hypothetical protein